MCKTETELKCSRREVQVCEQVRSKVFIFVVSDYQIITVCQVPMSSCTLVGYTECVMQDEPVTFTETEVITDGTFTKKECVTEYRYLIMHTGMH